MKRHNMKMHSDLNKLVSKRGLFKLAKKSGLNKIKFNKQYTLVKTAIKDNDKHRNIDTGYSTRGYPLLIGDGKEFVALYISGLQEWFKTSPVIACKKVKDGYKIETENSFYLLKTV